MLTKEQQKIVIESMRSYDPIRIAYNAWDSKKDFIELLYDFNEEVDLMDTTHIILDLEDAFGCEVNLVHYDCINRFSKERVLGEAIEFFNERNTTREVAGTIG